VFNFKV